MAQSREDRRKVRIGDRTLTLARHHKNADPDGSPQRQPVKPPGEDKGPKATGIVARGRTVHANDPNAPKRFVGFDKEGVGIWVPSQRIYSPGEQIELPVSELERLKRLGFIADANRLASDEEAAGVPTRHPSMPDEPRKSEGDVVDLERQQQRSRSAPTGRPL